MRGRRPEEGEEHWVFKVGRAGGWGGNRAMLSCPEREIEES